MSSPLFGGGEQYDIATLWGVGKNVPSLLYGGGEQHVIPTLWEWGTMCHHHYMGVGDDVCYPHLLSCCHYTGLKN